MKTESTDKWEVFLSEKSNAELQDELSLKTNHILELKSELESLKQTISQNAPIFEQAEETKQEKSNEKINPSKALEEEIEI